MKGEYHKESTSPLGKCQLKMGKTENRVKLPIDLSSVHACGVTLNFSDMITCVSLCLLTLAHNPLGRPCQPINLNLVFNSSVA